MDKSILVNVLGRGSYQKDTIIRMDACVCVCARVVCGIKWEFIRFGLYSRPRKSSNGHLQAGVLERQGPHSCAHEADSSVTIQP